MTADYWTGSTSVCPSCGAPLEPGASFCTMCGAAIPAGGDSSFGASTCSVCGAPLDPGASFCIMCGSPVGTPTGQAPIPPTSGDVCPVCGEPLDPGASFCIMCGAPVGAATPSGPTFNPDPVFPGVFNQDPTGMNVPGGFPPTDTNYQTVETTSAGTTSFGFAPANQPSQPIAHTDDKMADDDDPTVRPKLLMLTYDEARNGCTKSVNVDGQNIEVTIPAGVDVNTKLDVPNYGYFDEMTGARGPLRLTFFLV